MATGKPKPETLTKLQATALRRVVESKTEQTVSTEIGVSTETLARLLAGMSVRRGTLSLALQYLENASKNRDEANT